MGIARPYLLSPEPYPGTIHLPMLAFAYFDKPVDLAGINGIILTSKHAVNALEHCCKDQWHKIPAAVIGEATQRAAEAAGGRVIYCAGSSYGDDLADEIVRYFPDRNWLYARPETVVSQLVDRLRNTGVSVREAVVYATRCTNPPFSARPPEGSVLIFTSPSTVRCFIKTFGWSASYRAVVIGRRTLAALPPNTEAVTAAKPMIADAVEASQALLGGPDKPEAGV